jgi:hypothetical protein
MTEDTTVPKTAAPQGAQAIEALEKLIQEIKESNPEELTEGQAAIVIRVARVLITVLDQETPVWKSIEFSDLLGRIKTTMGRLIDEISKARPSLEATVTTVKDQALFDLNARQRA